MAVFVIGDVQGCFDELEMLVDALHFDAGKDRLWFVGDLVNRGPKSLETLRFVRDLGNAAICVLGNHDLHLLALADDSASRVDDKWLKPVLQADDRDELIPWLMHRPMAHYDEEMDTLMVHAGVDARWTVADTLRRAGEVEAILRSPQATDLLSAVRGSRPSRWSDTLDGTDRIRFIINCLTRIRYCKRDGELDFAEKLAPGTQPEHLVPWFELPDRAARGSRIVFGHWSTLGFMRRNGLLALDTGCVWAVR